MKAIFVLLVGVAEDLYIPKRVPPTKEQEANSPQKIRRALTSPQMASKSKERKITTPATDRKADKDAKKPVVRAAESLWGVRGREELLARGEREEGGCEARLGGVNPDFNLRMRVRS